MTEITFFMMVELCILRLSARFINRGGLALTPFSTGGHP